MYLQKRKETENKAIFKQQTIKKKNNNNKNNNMGWTICLTPRFHPNTRSSTQSNFNTKLKPRATNMPKVGVATGDNNKIQKRLGRNAINNLYVHIV